jgi:hypothetical protein
MMGDNLLIQLKYPYIIDVQLYMFNWYLLSVNYWYISIYLNLSLSNINYWYINYLYISQLLIYQLVTNI